MALPIAARGRGAPARPPVPWTARPVTSDGTRGEARVTLLMLDGASLAHIWPRAAEGRLPNFSRILDGGAAMDLATIRPTQPDPVWTAVATGMYPAASGVRSAARYYARGDQRGIDLLPDHTLSHALVHLGFVRNAPLTSGAWGARPLWGILSDQGMPSGIVRWPLTHPAQPSAGFMVSDRLHEVTGSIAEYDRAAYPSSALAEIQPFGDTALDRAPEGVYDAGFTAGQPEQTALQRDLLYARVARALLAERDARLFALRYTGLDSVGHYYFRYAQATPPRGVPEEQRRRFEGVVDRYYAVIDAEIGRALDAMAPMAPGDLFLVVSGFGMDPVGPAKRLLARVIGDADFSGTHDRAPDGFLIAYGAAVQPGRPQRGSIVDVTPTLLYFFGLPVARDMDGYARADLFTPEFSAERPVSSVPSYR
jgi:predicted AlkP superfamily phosphohydrolase/phosphomutase